MSPPVPRVFLIRHGETEWSLDGRHTGTTDIPLTEIGERRIRATGRALVGPDRLIVPSNLAAIFVSPRTRARRTLRLLVDEGLGGHQSGPEGEQEKKEVEKKVEVREDVREWDYGDYEGRTSKDIKEERHAKGMGDWSIWRDGCPGGESPQQMMDRLDSLISDIRQRFHAPALDQTESEKCPPCDVLVVAHGHVLRSLASRWVGNDISHNPSLLLEAGGVGCLSYEHRNIEEPAILLGGAFVVDAVEDAAAKK
ncbi:MAG: hypothetical protein M1828_004525 [Chrysothrix sp. TS-e1954]|nr:MAG: hypothetical protein M1828_004525 [Chrysothrix sp. TS-e1954]